MFWNSHSNIIYSKSLPKHEDAHNLYKTLNELLQCTIARPYHKCNSEDISLFIHIHTYIHIICVIHILHIFVYTYIFTHTFIIGLEIIVVDILIQFNKKAYML